MPTFARETGTLAAAALVSLAAAFLSGCGGGDDLVLVADGRRLTASGRDREIALREKLFGLVNQTATVAEAERFRRTLEDTAEEHFIVETGLLGVARDRGLSVGADAASHRLAPVAAALKRLDPGERKLAEEIAEREELCELAVRALESEIDARVSEGELDDGMRRLAEYAQVVSATNALVYARATNVWTELKGGADFAATAARWSEDDDASSCEWGEFPLAALDDSPELRRMLPGMKPGDISPPVEGDNGLVIVRLRGVDRASDPVRYGLDRIFFRLPEDAPNPTREELAAELAAERRGAALKTVLAKIRASTKVSRPVR